MNELRVLSLGAGVQSSTLLLMAAVGEIEPYDVAIFADTGWEPTAVYDHLAWLRDQASSAGITVEVLSGRNIRDDIVRNAAGEQDRFVSIPVFVTKPDGTPGMLRRQCTKHYKVEPVRRRIRELRQGRGVELTLGISLDEAIRMRDSDVSYIVHCYPLVDRRMTRTGCLDWLRDHGYPTPPKSSCIGCPFHDDRRWREMRTSDPASWHDAVEADRHIRNLPRIDGNAYLHRSRLPLDQVDLSTEEDRGQLPMFAMECDGMCGV